MMAGLGDRLRQDWLRIPPARRTALKVGAWGLALVAVWQGLWLPGQQRLEHAAMQLQQERVLARHLLVLTPAPVAAQTSAPALTAARLNEWAQAEGLLTVDLHSNAKQLTMTVQGAPQPVMAWLQALEQGGAQMTEILLQAAGEQMQASIGLVLDDG